MALHMLPEHNKNGEQELLYVAKLSDSDMVDRICFHVTV